MESVQGQIQAYHDHYNGLVDIENARRLAYDAARRSAVPGLVEAEEEIAPLEAELAAATEAANLAARTGKGPSPKRCPEVARIKKALKAPRARARSLRATGNEMLAPGHARKEELDCAKRGVGADGKKLAVAPRIAERLNEEVTAELLADDSLSEFYRAVVALEADALAKSKALRGTTGCTAGTYLMAERAFDSARKKRAAGLLHRRRWDGGGKVAVQLRKLSTEGLFQQASTMLQVDRLPSNTWDDRGRPRRKPRKYCETRARIRCGSDGRMPVWAELRVWMHQPLPANTSITWAWLQVRRHGGETTYSLQLTLDGDLSRTASGQGACAIDFGWRHIPDHGLRVGFLRGEDGHRQELLIPEQLVKKLVHPDALRSVTDTVFADAKSAFRDLMDADDTPEWVREEGQYHAQWRSPRRLATIVWRRVSEIKNSQSLWHDWERERKASRMDLLDTREVIESWLASRGVSGSELTWLYLEWWRKKNKHIYMWESSLRLKAIAARKEIFRCWAKQIATRYSDVVLEDFDLRNVSRLRDGASEQEKRANHYRTLACVSTLRDAIYNACGKSRVHKINAAGSTYTCHVCGHDCRDDDTWAPERSVTHECGQCRTEWDQDENASINMISFMRERSGGDAEQTR
jgi:hypothetical protein